MPYIHNPVYNVSKTNTLLQVLINMSKYNQPVQLIRQHWK